MYVLFNGGKDIEFDWSLDDPVTYNAPALLLQITDTEANGGWNLYGFEFPAAQANGSTTLHIRQNGAGVDTMYIDGVQVEEKTYWTSFCDGDQDGCLWEGTRHASTSRRYAPTRSGGRIYDFTDDYSFNVGAYLGLGEPPYHTAIDRYPTIEASRLNQLQLEPRRFSLIGSMQGTSWSNLHSLRQDLLEELAPKADPEDDSGTQPVKIWYTGATRTKEIEAYFVGGLDLALDASRDPCYFQRRMALQFLATDPYWYDIGTLASRLYASRALTLRYITGKQWTSDNFGEWTDMSVGAITNPVAVYAIAVGPDKKIYVGGNFDTIDGVANTLNIAAYDPATDTWEALGAGLENGTANGSVRALRFGPDGVLYAGGDFDNAGGDANADHLAQWNGAAWSAVGGGPGAVATLVMIYALEFDKNGILYIGGDFTDWNGNVDSDYIVSWDGAAYAPLDADELDDHVRAIKTAPNGDIYIGGNFQNKAGPVSMDRICYWDGTDFQNLGTDGNNGVNAEVRAIAIDNAGLVYLGGDFTTARGDTVNYIARWNGTGMAALGSGTGAAVHALDIGPDNALWVGGAFSSISGLNWVDRIARWMRDGWAATDLDLPGSPTVYALVAGNQRPDRKRNYDVWAGFDTTGAATAGRVYNFSAAGSARAYPVIIANVSGSTARLGSLKEGFSAKEIVFDYTLQDGDEITINLQPDDLSISTEFFGSIPEAVVPSSDIASFPVLPGGNSLVSYNPGMTDVFIKWRIAYESID
jgi:hypothetical protein